MRSAFGTIRSTPSGWHYAQYILNGCTYSQTFDTREDAVAWLQEEQATVQARRQHRITCQRLRAPEEGGTNYSYLFSTGVKVNTAAVGNPTDMIVILPPALAPELQRIDAAIANYLCPTWHHVRVTDNVRCVSAICGHGIPPHEQRTLWDILVAAADRCGYVLSNRGTLSRADELTTQAQHLRDWTTAYEEAS